MKSPKGGISLISILHLIKYNYEVKANFLSGGEIAKKLGSEANQPVSFEMYTYL